MRTIQVTPEVFAAIWDKHQPGEANENEILARVLSAKPLPAPPKARSAAGAPQPLGFSEPRFGFTVERAFKIHRIYLGRRYEAYAESNGWVRTDTEQSFSTLRDLSASIGTKTENVWFHWHYTRNDGTEGRLGELRDQNTIIKRRRRR